MSALAIPTEAHGEAVVSVILGYGIALAFIYPLFSYIIIKRKFRYAPMLAFSYLAGFPISLALLLTSESERIVFSSMLLIVISALTPILVTLLSYVLVMLYRIIWKGVPSGHEQH